MGATLPILILIWRLISGAEKYANVSCSNIFETVRMRITSFFLHLRCENVAKNGRFVLSKPFTLKLQGISLHSCSCCTDLSSKILTFESVEASIRHIQHKQDERQNSSNADIVIRPNYCKSYHFHTRKPAVEATVERKHCRSVPL